MRRHEAAGTTSSPEHRAAETAFYARHMCRKDPCPGEEFRAGGPDWNPVRYEYIWGPTEFHATRTLNQYDVSKRLPKNPGAQPDSLR